MRALPPSARFLVLLFLTVFLPVSPGAAATPSLPAHVKQNAVDRMFANPEVWATLPKNHPNALLEQLWARAYLIPNGYMAEAGETFVFQYTFNDKLTLLGTIVNGWNAVVDNNSRKSYGVQAALKPLPALSIVQNYMGGPEQPDDAADWRHLSDTTVTYTLTPAVSLMANYDYGHDTLLGKGVGWNGIAGYARIQANKRIAVSPRVEWFEDSDGFMTGTPQRLKEVTLTGEVKLADNLLWRMEYRHDLSDVASFRADRGAMMRTQNTIGFGVLYSFSTKP